MASSRSTRSLDTCPLCGGGIKPRYRALRDRLEATQERFGISECQACCSAFLNPMPIGDMARYYPSAYLSGEDTSGSRRRRPDIERLYRYNQYKYDMKLLSRAVGLRLGDVSSYLDIGCGSGERVAFAAACGVDRSCGIDRFDFVKADVRRKAGLINSDLFAFRPEARFELASMFHVLEHVLDPLASLKHIREHILAPEGHLIVQVPNYASIERRIFGARWFGLDAPRHLWHFTPKSLTNVLTRAGFSVQATFVANAPLHPVTIVPSIARNADVQRIWVTQRDHRGRRRALMLTWASLSVLAIPFSLIQNIVGGASMLTVIAATGQPG